MGRHGLLEGLFNYFTFVNIFPPFCYQPRSKTNQWLSVSTRTVEFTACLLGSAKAQPDRVPVKPHRTSNKQNQPLAVSIDTYR
jgi:hypothetical protein